MRARRCNANWVRRERQGLAVLAAGLPRPALQSGALGRRRRAGADPRRRTPMFSFGTRTPRRMRRRSLGPPQQQAQGAHRRRSRNPAISHACGSAATAAIPACRQDVDLGNRAHWRRRFELLSPRAKHPRHWTGALTRDGEPHNRPRHRRSRGTSSRRRRRSIASAICGSSSDQGELGPELSRRADVRRSRERRAAGDPVADGRGGVRAADRLRQRRQPDGRARVGAQPRAGRSRGDRRQPRTARPRRCWRRAW